MITPEQLKDVEYDRHVRRVASILDAIQEKLLLGNSYWYKPNDIGIADFCIVKDVLADAGWELQIHCKTDENIVYHVREARDAKAA